MKTGKTQGQILRAEATPWGVVTLSKFSPKGDPMRDLTLYDLDNELAEQLPARELMGGYCGGSSHTTTVVSQSGNGSFDGGNVGLVNVVIAGNGSGDNLL
jgi:hypothetical protein